MTNSKPTIGVVIAMLVLISGCAQTLTTKSGNEIDPYVLREHCYAMADASRNYERAKRQVANAELFLANIRATVVRGEKRSPLAKMMAAHGLQNDQLGPVAWAEGMLENEDIEEESRSKVWQVELRQAKDAYETLVEQAEDLDDALVKVSRKARATGIQRDTDCN